MSKTESITMFVLNVFIIISGIIAVIFAFMGRRDIVEIVMTYAFTPVYLLWLLSIVIFSILDFRKFRKIINDDSESIY